MDFGIQGKNVLVMGASAGIGKAVAQCLVEEGANVGICSRTESTLKKTADEIGAKGIFPADLTQPKAGEQVVKDFLQKMGNLDVLITNTGGPPKGLFESLTTENWQTGFQSLYVSVIESIQAALPSMKENKWGRIIMITSVAAREAMPKLTISNGLRAGLLGLMKTLNNEIACHGITVNCLLPGYTNTDRLKELGLSEQFIRSQVPAGRMAEPEEIGYLASFLASEKAGYISGQAIACDGGYLKGF